MEINRRLMSFHSSSKAADGPSAGLGAFLASWALAAIPPRQDKQNTTANSIHFFISTLLGTRSQNLLCQTDEFPLSFAWIIRKDRPGITSRHHTIGTGGCRKEGKLGRTARLGILDYRSLSDIYRLHDFMLSKGPCFRYMLPLRGGPEEGQ